MHPETTHAAGPGPGPAPGAGQGFVAGSVIHDIGYRRYEGQRLGRASIIRALFVQGLRSTYGLGRTAKSKVLPFILLTVMLLPALILEIVLIVSRSQEGLAQELFNDQLIPYTRYAVVTQAAIGIYLASQAPQLFSRDLRFRTITLYFSRPLTRFDYVLAKYASLVAALTILMAAPLLVMYLGGLLARLPFGDQTADFALGLVGVLLFAMVFAAIGALIASLTPRRGFGVAAIITVLTVSYAGVSAVAGIAQALGNDRLAGYIGVFSPVTVVDGVQSLLLGAPYSGVQEPPSGALAAIVFLLALVITVGGCFGLLLLRYRKAAAA